MYLFSAIPFLFKLPKLIDPSTCLLPIFTDMNIWFT